MTCGIYKLTFSSGRSYIGKSIDIENRWKQHFEKMRSGKASKPMQEEFMRCGYPDPAILYICHEDHIDIIEETLIHRLNPELNTTKGRERLNSDDNGLVNKSEILEELLGSGTMGHIAEIAKHRERTYELLAHVDTLLEGTRKLTEARSQEELTYDVMGRIKSAESISSSYKKRMEAALHKVDKLEKELEVSRTHTANLVKYIETPWWNKLFS